MKGTTLLYVGALCCTAVVAQAQTITVASPAGGASWKKGSMHAIQWSSAGLSAGQTVSIILWLNGARLGDIALNVPATQGQYQWTVGSYQGGQSAPGSGYRIRVRTADVLGDSAAFTIAAASGASLGVADHSMVSSSSSGPTLAVQNQPMIVIPDLVVCASSSVLTSWPSGGFLAVVLNRGKVPAAATTARAAVDKLPPQDIPVIPLDPGEYYPVSYRLVVVAGMTPVVGSHYTVTADVSGKVRESSEANNTLTRSLAITNWTSIGPVPLVLSCSDGTTLPLPSGELR
jgi:hypothetical protein